MPDPVAPLPLPPLPRPYGIFNDKARLERDESTAKIIRLNDLQHPGHEDHA